MHLQYVRPKKVVSMTSVGNLPVLNNPVGLVRHSRIRPVFRQAPLMVAVGTIVAILAPLFAHDPALIFLVFAMWLGLVGGTIAYVYSLSQSQRHESREVQSIEDAIQFKQDIPAGMRLQMLLSAPMYAPELRARAILLIAVLLGRHYRYEESIAVCNSLLDENVLAVPSQITVKLTRVMAMLHADQLYDADRAINELRKLIDRGDSPGPSTAAAMLRWVEIFRDVKTGHSQEAVDAFLVSRDMMRDVLGHRMGEVYALIASAYDRLGDADQAAKYFADATAIWPLAELQSRYPQVNDISPRYTPTYAPSFGAPSFGAPSFGRASA